MNSFVRIALLLVAALASTSEAVPTTVGYPTTWQALPTAPSGETTAQDAPAPTPVTVGYPTTWDALPTADGDDVDDGGVVAVKDESGVSSIVTVGASVATVVAAAALL